jgi:hypothetical protein
MKPSLKELEARLERWIEGSIIRLFNHPIPAATLATQLAQAMETGLHVSEHGVYHAPDNYRVSLSPETLQKLEIPTSELANQLSAGLYQIARDHKYLLSENPLIIITPDPELSPLTTKVAAWHSTSPLEETHEMVAPIEKNSSHLPTGAFLIVDGDQHFLLDRPVINIGRRQDNQLILDNPKISRTHAQIRARQGRFVLFDLGSRSGTYVNEIAIRQHILQPGDVIRLAGVHLVYGEESFPNTDETMGFTTGPLRKMDT